MASLFGDLMGKLYCGASVDASAVRRTFLEVLHNSHPQRRDVQLGSMLTALMLVGPRKDHVIAMFEAMLDFDGFDLAARRRVSLPGGAPLIGVAGSGKKGVKTFNISTGASVIAAACGAYVAKPISRSASSLTGSADVLELLGAPVTLPSDEVIDVLRELGVGFLSIERTLQKFDEVYGRRILVASPFSFGLAGLACPVRFDRLFFGLSHGRVDLAAEVLARFGQTDAMVVATTHDGIRYIDEVGVGGETMTAEIRNGHVMPAELRRPWQELVGRERDPREVAPLRTPAENAQALVDVLLGQATSAREDMVCINAAHLIVLSGRASALPQAYRMAKDAIRSGAAVDKLVAVVTRMGGRPALIRGSRSIISNPTVHAPRRAPELLACA